MNLQELLVKLHEYSDVEKYMMTHQDFENDNNSITNYLSSLDETANTEPIFTLDCASTNFHLADYEPSCEDHSINIHISQHNRYFPPFMHNHDYYELFFVYEGEFKQIICNNILTMRTGDICIIPPGVSHAMDVNNYSIVINFLIEKNTFKTIFLHYLNENNVLSNFYLNSIHSDLDNYLVFHTKGDLFIVNLVLDMFLEFKNKKNFFREKVFSYLMLLLSDILQQYENQAESKLTNSKSNILDTEILFYINKNYTTTDLSDLAKHFNYSKEYVSARIKNYTGVSFSKYICQLRISTAADLLEKTNTKINEITFLVGFRNIEYFIRSFKKVYGITPSQFRKSRQLKKQ